MSLKTKSKCYYCNPPPPQSIQDDREPLFVKEHIWNIFISALATFCSLHTHTITPEELKYRTKICLDSLGNNANNEIRNTLLLEHLEFIFNEPLRYSYISHIANTIRNMHTHTPTELISLRHVTLRIHYTRMLLFKLVTDTDYPVEEGLTYYLKNPEIASTINEMTSMTESNARNEFLKIYCQQLTYLTAAETPIELIELNTEAGESLLREQLLARNTQGIDLLDTTRREELLTKQASIKSFSSLFSFIGNGHGLKLVKDQDRLKMIRKHDRPTSFYLSDRFKWQALINALTIIQQESKNCQEQSVYIVEEYMKFIISHNTLKSEHRYQEMRPLLLTHILNKIHENNLPKERLSFDVIGHIGTFLFGEPLATSVVHQTP